MYKKPFVIAEVGCNHKGDMDIAHELIIEAANFCNVDAIKFQKRNVRELLSESQYNLPHPNLKNAYGKTYGEHREYLEFSLEQHMRLKEWCEEAEIVYSASVWDMTSAKEIVSLNPQFIKIPSACNNNYEMLSWICDNYKGEIQISIGMTTHEEEEEIVRLCESKGRARDLVVFACTSGYPVPFSDVCLLEISRIRKKYVDRVKDIGFSGHHLGIAIDIAAYTMGSNLIERHFTLDRTWKGTDHAASLEPMGLRKLVRNLDAVNQAICEKSSEILPIETVQRNKLKYKKSEEIE